MFDEFYRRRRSGGITVRADAIGEGLRDGAAANNDLELPAHIGLVEQLDDFGDSPLDDDDPLLSGHLHQVRMELFEIRDLLSVGA